MEWVQEREQAVRKHTEVASNGSLMSVDCISLPINIALSSLERENGSSNVCCMWSFLINPACVVEH